MHVPKRTARTDGAERQARRWLALGILALASVVATAADIAVFEATVPLEGDTEADRVVAFGNALRTVAVRATGQRDAGQDPAVAAAAGDASRYVQRYVASADRMITVGFDAAAVGHLLLKSGLPLWPRERPVTLVLMSGADGGVVRAGDRTAARTEFEAAAEGRGLPLAWPATTVDLAAVRAEAGAGNLAGVLAAAGTDADAVLIGRPRGGQIDWSLVHGGRSVERRGGVAGGAHLAADTYGEIYAPASTRGIATFAIDVTGIDGVGTYAALMNYLESLSLVHGVSVSALDGSTLTLALELRGDLALFGRVAALSTHLRPVVAPDAARQAFVFEP